MELSWSLVPVLERFIECTFGSKSLKNRDLMHKAVNFIRTHYRERLGAGGCRPGKWASIPRTSASCLKRRWAYPFTDYLSKGAGGGG